MARQFVYQDAHGRLHPAHAVLALQPGLVPGWYDTDSVGADVGGVVGSVLPYLAPTRALQGIGRKVAGTVLPRRAATGIAGRAVSGATQGAITGALQPVTEDDFARAKAKQAGLDAAFGGAVPVATGALAPVLGKAVNAARSVIDPAARQLQDLGERFGVRLSYGDLTQKALPMKAEVALESIPVLSTGGFRAAQQAETRAAAEGVSERLHSQLKQTPFQHLAEVDQAAARGNKAAIELKQELANAGDDWNAMEKAVDETRNVFSPAKFAQAMERVKDAQGAFFRGASKQEIEGFTKLMRHVERAGQYAENPPTGQRKIPWLLGGAAAINAPLAAKVAAVSGIARALLTTDVGKRFLLAGSKLEAGSPAMAQPMQRVERAMPGLAGAVVPAEGISVHGSVVRTE